ncbi:MAG: peroxiredoxin [Deltaproteobacteria bacterium]|nr:peroxiredoxin [Deltaproteobacteria bacterium]
MAGLNVGAPAPDFKVKDQDGKDVRLSDFRGKKVLLSFHPLAWTSVCSRQMESLEANRKLFERLNTVALGVSIDTSPSKKEWAKSLGIKDTRLLADFWQHGNIAKNYGIFRENDGFSERANVIVDEEGKIRFFKVYPIGELPDIKEIIEVLEGKK